MVYFKTFLLTVLVFLKIQHLLAVYDNDSCLLDYSCSQYETQKSLGLTSKFFSETRSHSHCADVLIIKCKVLAIIGWCARKSEYMKIHCAKTCKYCKEEASNEDKYEMTHINKCSSVIDTDSDGIVDDCDNCPLNSNSDQNDIDGDLVGDVCDNCIKFKNIQQIDSDKDEVGDECDNCPNIFNKDQKDTDGDGIGDLCDYCVQIRSKNQNDIDGDKVGDECDNCIYISNNNQKDVDNDGVGDACDNCPDVSNKNQSDSDFDKIGDACDTCFDKNSQYFEKERDFSRVDSSDFVANNIGGTSFIGVKKYDSLDFKADIYVPKNTDNYIGFILSHHNHLSYSLIVWEGQPKFSDDIILQKNPEYPSLVYHDINWFNISYHDKYNYDLLVKKEPEVKNAGKTVYLSRNFPWQAQTIYTILIINRPKLNLLRVKIFDKDKNEILDSGNRHVESELAGTVGFYLYSRFEKKQTRSTTYKNIFLRCNDHAPDFVYKDLSDEMKKKTVIDKNYNLESFIRKDKL